MVYYLIIYDKDEIMGSIKVKKIVNGSFAVNTIVIEKENTDFCLIIDSGEDHYEVENYLTENSLRPAAFLYTHAHIDHIGSAYELVHKYSVPVFLNENDTELYKRLNEQADLFYLNRKESLSEYNTFKDNDILTFPEIEGLSIEVLETPGHTKGSSCFYLSKESILLSGDTLFSGGIGRTDLPGSVPEMIIPSITDRIFTLPEKVRVISGHGEDTYVEYEKRTNPFFL